MKTLATVLMLTISVSASAESHIPKPDYVVSKTTIHYDKNLSIFELEKLVLRSQNVGETEVNQGFLKTELAKRYQDKPTAKVGYLYARVLQREHLFDDAIEVIDNVLETTPNDVNSRLLKANMLQVKGKDDKRFLIMSQAAHDCLTPAQIKMITKHCDIVSSSLDTIESCGGGSARCMMAEVFLPMR